MRLDECHEGDRLVVKRLHGTGFFRKRLLEMGVIRGTPLLVLRYAPLKDPIEIQIKDYRLSLRCKEAHTIEVAAEPL